ncbi:oligosaccharide flippase family protein [Octadecabacter sp. 1_MG-2023]|uniref:oligosaccharide flippase family protein n=1 Tax=unclassified Octadecabacter TaxID=196158 RepID=UPI001C098EF5|nr:MULTISPECIES: oligosaccharide flippase family protein [unclassified Octadecabacter]MBU2994498.1 oligosaccharide flippase family protein [Octadecabacter sp. B2R22]MDO6734209.1 oligosaccharide flippase family protein [Octadecabacter sp. 1_MG-2023]
MIRPNHSKSFATNLIAYGASEVASKASRLLVVVAVARTLDLTQIGVAAAALAAGDILKSLTENGVGQRIIAARDEDLDETCATAHRIFWVWCVGLFLAQAGIAAALYVYGTGSLLAGLVLLMGIEYLFMPAGLVQVALAMRAGQLKQTAAIAGAQVVGANLISIVLVLIWPTAIALVLPRILSAPIWLIAVRRLHPWTNQSQQRATLRPFLNYGWAVLGVEVVKVMRLQADKLVVGATLGAETLGLYFMAFNAGLSLSNAFTTALSTVLFPLFSQSTDRLVTLRQSLLIGVGMIAPLVVLQTVLAPIYVPILLGDGWDGIETLVQLLCLLAIPTTLWATTASWLRTTNRAHVELMVTAILATVVIANALVLGPFGLPTLTLGYVITSTTVMLLAAILILHPTFKLPNRSVTI